MMELAGLAFTTFFATISPISVSAMFAALEWRAGRVAEVVAEVRALGHSHAVTTGVAQEGESWLPQLQVTLKEGVRTHCVLRVRIPDPVAYPFVELPAALGRVTAGDAEGADDVFDTDAAIDAIEAEALGYDWLTRASTAAATALQQ